MYNLFEMGGSITLQDNASRSLQNINGNVDRFGTSLTGNMAKVGKWAASITAASLAVAAALGGVAVKAASDFEGEMANVSTLLGGDVETRIEELGESVLDLSKDVNLGTDLMTDGLYQVISAFGDTAESMEILTVAGQAAKAGNTTVTASIDLLSAVTKGYGDTSAEAAQKASDLAFKTVQLGQTTFPELASSMGKVIPLANSLNISQEELFGTFATLTGVIGNTSEVSTGLKATFTSLMTPSEEMQKIIEKMGYSTGSAALESLGLQRTLATLKEEANKNDVAFKDLFTSSEALTASLALTGTQADNFIQKTEAMYKASGETQKAFDKQNATFKSTISSIKNYANVVGIEIGTKALPIMQEFANYILKSMPKIEGAIKKTFSLIGDFTDDVVGGLKTATNSFENSEGDISGFFKNVSKEMQEFTTDINQASKNWISNNEGTLQELSKSFEKILDTMLQVGGKILDKISDLWEDNGDDIKTTYLKSIEFISDTVLKWWTFILKLWADNSGEILKIIDTALSLIEKVITTVSNAIKLFWDAWGNDIKNLFDTIFSTVQTVISTAFDVILDVVQGGLSLLSGDFEGFKNEVVSIFNTLVAGVTDIFSKIWGFLEPYITTLVTNVIEFFKPVTDLFKMIFDGWAIILSTVWNTLKSGFDAVLSNISDWVRNVDNFMIENFGGIWLDVKESAAGAWEIVKSGFAEFQEAISKWVIDIKDRVKEDFSLVWGSVKDSVSDFAANFFGTGQEAGKKVGESVAAGIEDSTENLKGSIYEKMLDVVDTVKDAINDKSTEVFEKAQNFGENMVLKVAEGSKNNIAEVEKAGEEVGEKFGTGVEKTVGYSTEAVKKSVSFSSAFYTDLQKNIDEQDKKALEKTKYNRDRRVTMSEEEYAAYEKGYNEYYKNIESEAAAEINRKKEELAQYEKDYNEYYKNLGITATNSATEQAAAVENIATLGGFGDLISSVGAQIGGTFGDVTAGITAGADVASKAMSGDFIGAATSIIQNWDVFESAVSSIFGSLFKKSETTGEKIQKSWSKMLEHVEVDFEDSLEIIGSNFSELADDIAINAKDMEGYIVKPVQESQAAFLSFQNTVNAVMAAIKEEVHQVAGLLAADIAIAVSQATTEFELLDDVTDAVFEAFEDTIDIAYENWEVLSKETLDQIREATEEGLKEIGELVEDMTDIAIDEADRLGDAIIEALETKYEKEQEIALQSNQDTVDMLNADYENKVESLEKEMLLYDVRLAAENDLLTAKVSIWDKELSNKLDAAKTADEAAKTTLDSTLSYLDTTLKAHEVYFNEQIELANVNLANNIDVWEKELSEKQKVLDAEAVLISENFELDTDLKEKGLEAALKVLDAESVALSEAYETKEKMYSRELEKVAGELSAMELAQTEKEVIYTADIKAISEKYSTEINLSKETLEKVKKDITEKSDLALQDLENRKDIEIDKYNLIQETYNKELELAKDFYSDQIIIISDSFEITKSNIEKEIDETKEGFDEKKDISEKYFDRVEKNYDKLLETNKNNIEKELDLLESSFEKKKAMYNDDYNAKLVSIDEEARKEIANREAQIKDIENMREEEKKIEEQAKFDKEKSELEKALLEADTAEDRADIQESLDELLSERQKDLIEAQRDLRIEALEKEIQNVEDKAEAEADIEAQILEDKIAKEELALQSQKTALENRQAETTLFINNVIELEKKSLDIKLANIDIEAAKSTELLTKQLENEQAAFDAKIANLEVEKINTEAYYLNLTEKNDEALEKQLANLDLAMISTESYYTNLIAQEESKLQDKISKLEEERELEETKLTNTIESERSVHTIKKALAEEALKQITDVYNQTITTDKALLDTRLAQIEVEKAANKTALDEYIENQRLIADTKLSDIETQKQANTDYYADLADKEKTATDNSIAEIERRRETEIAATEESIKEAQSRYDKEKTLISDAATNWSTYYTDLATNATSASDIKTALLEAEKTAAAADLAAAELNDANALAIKLALLAAEKQGIEDHYESLLFGQNLQAEAVLLAQSEDQDELLELLDSYNPGWQDAGQSFGEQLVIGLNSEMESVSEAVDNILGQVSEAQSAIEQLETLTTEADQMAQDIFDQSQIDYAAQQEAIAQQQQQQVVIGVGTGGQPIYGDPSDKTTETTNKTTTKAVTINNYITTPDSITNVQDLSRLTRELEQEAAIV